MSARTIREVMNLSHQASSVLGRNPDSRAVNKTYFRVKGFWRFSHFMRFKPRWFPFRSGVELAEAI